MLAATIADRDLAEWVREGGALGNFGLVLVGSVVGRLRDLTVEARIALRDRMRAEEETRPLALAVTTTNEAVIIAEMDGQVSFVNRAAELMCGYTAGEMLGIEVFDLHADSSEHPTAGDIIDATVTDGFWTGEVLFQKKTGEEFPVRLSTALMTDQEGRPTGIVGIAADITERLELENLFPPGAKDGSRRSAGRGTRPRL